MSRHDTVAQRLDVLWARLKEVETPPDPVLEQLINSNLVSIRLCWVTQLVGKWDDMERDLLCLQRGGAENNGSWDARSFCSSHVAPWLNQHGRVRGQ